MTIKTIVAIAACNAILLAGISYGHAAVVKDQTCTHKDGTSHACSVKQQANMAHIKACGLKWKDAKSDATVKAAGWPAYWHTCSQAMKAAKN